MLCRCLRDCIWCVALRSPSYGAHPQSTFEFRLTTDNHPHIASASHAPSSAHNGKLHEYCSGDSSAIIEKRLKVRHVLPLPGACRVRSAYPIPICFWSLRSTLVIETFDGLRILTIPKGEEAEVQGTRIQTQKTKAIPAPKSLS